MALQAVDAVKNVEATLPAPVSLDEGKQLMLHFAFHAELYTGFPEMLHFEDGFAYPQATTVWHKRRALVVDLQKKHSAQILQGHAASSGCTCWPCC